MNGCELDWARLKMWADQAAGTEKCAVQVSTCTGTCLPQSRFSHASIIGDCRAPKIGGWVPGINSTHRGENSGYITCQASQFGLAPDVVGAATTSGCTGTTEMSQAAKARHLFLRYHFIQRTRCQFLGTKNVWYVGKKKGFIENSTTEMKDSLQRELFQNINEIYIGFNI